METIINVLNVLPDVADKTTKAIEKIKNALYKVQVVPTETKKMENDLKTIGITRFNTGFSATSSKGIHPDHMKDFLDKLAKYNDIDSTTRDKIELYVFSNDWDLTVMEVKYPVESTKETRYMMIVTEKKDGKYTCKYACCKIEFEIESEKVSETQTEILFGIFRNTEEHWKPKHVSIEVIKELENFIRYLITREFKDGDTVIRIINAA